MTRYERVKEILDNAVSGQNFAAHGRFWRNLTRDQFVARIVFGEQLLVIGDGNGSNIVRALRGESPFGSDSGTAGAMFRRMPAGLPPVVTADVDFIRQWIDDGCPEDEFQEEPGSDMNAGGPC